METQRVAQVEHQAQQVGEQEDEGDRIGHLRHGREDRRRRQLAERRDQEQPGRQVVEQQVPGDEPVPVGRLGHRAGRVAGGRCVAVWSRSASQWPRRRNTREQHGDRGQPADERRGRNPPSCAATG